MAALAAHNDPMALYGDAPDSQDNGNNCNSNGSGEGDNGAGNGQGSNSKGNVGTSNSNANAGARQSAGAHTTASFDAEGFLRGLDDIFARHAGPAEASDYLEEAMADAENAGDDAGLLTVLNETMGYYRSQGRHEENAWIVQRALELAMRMGLPVSGGEAWATTLINAATAMRAAGRFDQSADLYRQALAAAKDAFGPADRRVAALHNNLSMLYSDTGDFAAAHSELLAALAILKQTTKDAGRDQEIASTYTNLALVLLGEANEIDEAAENEAKATERREKTQQAVQFANESVAIYHRGHFERSAHYASALAGAAQAAFATEAYAEAARLYEEALSVIAECYGTDTDYYRITAANLEQARERAARETPQQSAEKATPNPPQEKAERTAEKSAFEPAKSSEKPAESAGATAQKPAPRVISSGLELSRAYWEEVVRPMVRAEFPAYESRIAAGLVGHGSECYGFDDAISRDHDFGPGVCLWLTANDYAAIGPALQDAYERLPREFAGFAPRRETARASGEGRRTGVFAIPDFFENLTGYAQAPAATSPHEWLLLPEATLAAATNGRVFADPLGEFSKTRRGFALMPDDVRVALISRRLGMMGQAGQANLPRSFARHDGAAAWACIAEFVDATASLVFLLNNPASVGYLPYYKWRFAALRRLARRMGTTLPQVPAQLETLLEISSAACFGGDETAQRNASATIEDIAVETVAALKAAGLTGSGETFLEWQRPYVEERIESEEPCLHSL